MGSRDLGKILTDGEVIFREGDSADCMYVILEGKIKITKEGPSGEVQLAVLQEGELFGEISFFDRLPRAATATSIGQSHILTVDKKMFFSNITRDPTIAFKVLEAMSSRVRRLNADYIKLSARQSEEPEGSNSEGSLKEVEEGQNPDDKARA